MYFVDIWANIEDLLNIFYVFIYNIPIHLTLWPTMTLTSPLNITHAPKTERWVLVWHTNKACNKQLQAKFWILVAVNVTCLTSASGLFSNLSSTYNKECIYRGFRSRRGTWTKKEATWLQLNRSAQWSRPQLGNAVDRLSTSRNCLRHPWPSITNAAAIIATTASALPPLNLQLSLSLHENSTPYSILLRYLSFLAHILLIT